MVVGRDCIPGIVGRYWLSANLNPSYRNQGAILRNRVGTPGLVPIPLGRLHSRVTPRPLDSPYRQQDVA